MIIWGSVGIDDGKTLAGFPDPVQLNAGVVDIATVGEEKVRAALDLVAVCVVLPHHLSAGDTSVQRHGQLCFINARTASGDVDQFVQQVDPATVAEEGSTNRHVQFLGGSERLTFGSVDGLVGEH
ncbi:hypothetical protein, partial [Nocardia abscessus]|uniref:hypothetical protein n=1 Tax=Nocardia abscessus TaxID=120957 RepID=UPI002454322E